VSCLGVVIGEHLWLVCDAVPECGLEGLCDVRVHLLPLALEERVVRGILHQGMFEGIGCIRRRAAAEHQPGSRQSLKLVFELCALVR
jgi:hypothetical protein